MTEQMLGACLGHPQRGLLAVGLVFARSAANKSQPPCAVPHEMVPYLATPRLKHPEERPPVPRFRKEPLSQRLALDTEAA